MKFRVVVYQAGSQSRDRDLLKRIQEITGEEPRTVAKHFSSSPVNYFPDLEHDQASALLLLLRDAKVNAESEPQDLGSTEQAWFLAESAKWIKRGLVMPFQLDLLYRHYRLELPAGILGAAPKKEKKSLVQNILTIGAVLVGLGIILFIASNWNHIAPSVKILTAMFLSGGLLQASGEFLRRGNEKIGQVLALISFFAIGGTIALVGQIYHVRADSYTLPLLWAALVLPAALLTGSLGGLVMTSTLLFLSHTYYQEQFQIGSWFLPPALVLMVVLSHKMKSPRVFGLNLVYFGLAAVLSVVQRDFIMSSIWVGAAGALSIWKKEERYELGWLGTWFLWMICFSANYENIPNIFYILPLAYFTILGIRRESPAFLSIQFINAVIWLFSILCAMEKREGWPRPGVLDFVLYGTSLGALAYGIGMRLRTAVKWKELSDLFCYGGVLVITVLSYALSFRFYTREAVFFKSVPYAVASMIFWGLGAYMAAKELLSFMNKEDARRWDELILLLGAAVTFELTMVLSPAAGLHVMLYNVFLFLLSLVLMVKGYREQKLVYYHAGIASFIGLIFSRYFDSLVEYIPKSLFFVLGGLFLIGWAVFIDREKKRFQPAEKNR